jgi:hypothetical protein
MTEKTTKTKTAKRNYSDAVIKTAYAICALLPGDFTEAKAVLEIASDIVGRVDHMTTPFIRRLPDRKGVLRIVP